MEYIGSGVLHPSGSRHPVNGKINLEGEGYGDERGKICGVHQYTFYITVSMADIMEIVG